MKRLLCLATLVLASPGFAQDGQFRGNPQHTGVYEAVGVPKFTGIQWQFQTSGQILSSPTIAGDTLYVGSSDHLLYALKVADGTLKWKFKTDGRVTSSPAVSAGLVYFSSMDSSFYAVEAATGQLKWKFKTEGERRFAAKHLHGAEPAAETMPDPFDFYLSSASVWNGTVYFGSGDTNIYALDAASGGLKWKFKTNDVVHSSPAISEGVLFAGSWDSYFYALDAVTGKEKWRFKTGEDPIIHNQVGIQSSAAVADGVVYFGCRDSKLYAVDATTGKERWSFSNKGSWAIASPAVRDGKVYFATSDTGLLYSLDAKSGAVLFSLDFKHWPMFSSPAIAGETLYIGSHQGKLLAIDLKSQKLGWSFETEGSKENGVTYTKPDGTPNYEAAFSDFFYDDMVSGLQKLMSVGAVLSSPAVAGRSVFVGSTDGSVYALM
ncbi:MAG TPA: PQQ-binding-like beta-propeller repeat protein [Candidatus Acidoferrum sp.]|nr:PQQ-binding-like beta-propeller repeat protein [Candidatus Acidoferrum sp.]